MKKIIVPFLIVGILLSGCTLFKQDPQKAVNEGVAKFSEVKIMNSDLILNGTMQSLAGEKPSNIKFSIKATGKTDLADDASPKVDSALKVELAFDDQKGSADVLLRIVDKKMFAKIENLVMPGADKSFAEQFSSILNTWWSMPLTDESSIGKLTKEQQGIQDLFKTAAFFMNATEEGAEDVHGVASTRYRVELSRDGLGKFILDAGRVTGNQITPEEELAISESLKDMEFSGAVWVGDDDYIHRVKGTIAVQPKDGPSSSFDFDFSAWDYGKGIEVVAPSEAKEFNPLILLPLFSVLGGQQDAAVPATPAK